MSDLLSVSQPSVLPRVVKALGGSYWFCTDDAHVIATDTAVSRLDLGSNPRQWWENVQQRLQMPNSSVCALCGQPQPLGATQIRMQQGDEQSVVVELEALGHTHRTDDDAALRDVFLVRSVADITEIDSGDGIEVSVPQSSAESTQKRGDFDLKSKTVDAYLSTLSHDLRTPLDGIIGYSEMLIEGDNISPSEWQRSVERIRDSGHQLLDTVSALERQIAYERHKRRVAETLRSLSTMMASSLEFDEVIDRIQQCISQVINFDRLQIILCGEAGLDVVLDRCPGDGSVPEVSPTAVTSSAFPYSELVDAVPESRVVICDLSDGEAETVHPQSKNWLGAAVMTGETLEAMICLESRVAEFYDDFDIDLMRSLSHHAALAMTNAKEYVQLRQQARIDPLTQTCTRGYFFAQLERAIDEATRSDEDLGLVMLDIDRFKPINDTYGHPAGDEILRQVAAEIRSSLRDADLIGRYGGEEFVILLPGANRDVAHRVADRIRRRIEDHTFKIDGEAVTITISAGVISLQASPSTAMKPLIKNADQALYRAKESGRNRVVQARPDAD